MKAAAYTTALILLLNLSASFAFAWGAKGHRIIAGIAQKHLSDEAARGIAVLAAGQDLASLATWPDTIRSDPQWDFAKPWHYVSIEDEASFANYQPAVQGDVLTQLQALETQLKSGQGNAVEPWQALAFYVHFVGDIHQPLHVGRPDDLGGNRIAVRWFGQKSNLHRVWDSQIIDSAGWSVAEFIEQLDRLSAEQIRTLQASDYLDWAEESKALRAAVYAYEPASNAYPRLGDEYLQANRPIVAAQLLHAGVRLAGKLNQIYHSHRRWQ